MGFRGTEPDLLFRGQALDLLHSLSSSLAGSALARGGPSRKAMETLLVEACTIRATDGDDAALDFIEQRLGEPRGTWTIVEPILALVPAENVPLGACHLFPALPKDFVWQEIDESVRNQISGPVAVVEVKARDLASAQVLAHDRIAEAHAILWLASHQRGSVGRQLVLQPGERVSISGGETALIAPARWDDEGRVHPTLSGLSEAAGREDESRTDWEKRVVAAARWFANAAESSWPSEALTSCMAALECLFVSGMDVRRKGREIARHVSARWVRKTMSCDEQEEWLRELYRARNAAVHEGRRYVEDLEVERLIDITRRSVTWGAWHLARDHSDDGTPCQTFEEVMAHDAERAG